MSTSSSGCTHVLASRQNDTVRSQSFQLATTTRALDIKSVPHLTHPTNVVIRSQPLFSTFRKSAKPLSTASVTHSNLQEPATYPPSLFEGLSISSSHLTFMAFPIEVKHSDFRWGMFGPILFAIGKYKQHRGNRNSNGTPARFRTLAYPGTIERSSTVPPRDSSWVATPM